MSRAKPETRDGRRRLSEEHRAKLRAASQAQWAGMSATDRAAALARIGRKPKPGESKPPATPAPAPDDHPEGRRSPLAMTPLELFRSLRGR